MERVPADDLREIAMQMKLGHIGYAAAHAMAAPIIERMNKRAKELAKEHGVPFKKISFTHFTR